MEIDYILASSNSSQAVTIPRTVNTLASAVRSSYTTSGSIAESIAARTQTPFRRKGGVVDVDSDVDSDVESSVEGEGREREKRKLKGREGGDIFGRDMRDRKRGSGYE